MRFEGGFWREERKEGGELRRMGDLRGEERRTGRVRLGGRTVPRARRSEFSPHQLYLLMPALFTSRFQVPASSVRGEASTMHAIVYRALVQPAPACRQEGKTASMACTLVCSVR